MRRRIMVLGALMVLAFGATQLSAHEAYRVVGKITDWKQPRLEVTTKEGKEVAIFIFSTTDIYRHKKKVTQKELRKGLSVVVDGLGDSETNLDGVKIEIR